jgi:probable rRNA maturation factor
MEPRSSQTRTAAGNSVIVADAGWRRLIRRTEAVADRAARAAGAECTTLLLASDRAVQRLNARHRGHNAPTNVIAFAPAGPGLPAEIVLALDTVRREAMAEGKRPAHHLAHLIVHGVLHLLGHDHHHPGEARRMEMAETRILHRIGVPNPWRRA